MKGRVIALFVLINPKCEDPRKNIFPLGLSYISSVLKKYGSVKIFDLHYSNDEDEMMMYFFSHSIKYAGITACTDAMPEITRLAKLIKQISPQTLIGIGGPHATFQGYETLTRHYEFDMAFLAEGELSAKQLAENLVSNREKWYEGISNIIFRDENNKIRYGETAICSLKEIPQPDRISFPSPDDMARKKKLDVPLISIDTSRGCAGYCSFCALAVDQKRRWKCRDLQQVYEELENIFAVYSYTQVDLFIVDADFLASPVRALKIIQIIRKFPQIRYYTIAACAHSILKAKDILEDLFESGCRTIEIGIESGSETQLIRYQKRSTVQQNDQAIELIKKYDQKYQLLISVDLVVFDPYVTRQELKQTIDFIKKHFYGENGKEPCLFSYLQLFTGTKLYRQAIKDGLAGGGSELQTPFWRFQTKDTETIYRYIKLFEQLIYINLCKLREELKPILESPERYFRDLKSRLQFMKDFRWLNIISYDYFSFVLDNQEETIKLEFSKIYDKLREIEDKYSALEMQMV